MNTRPTMRSNPPSSLSFTSATRHHPQMLTRKPSPEAKAYKSSTSNNTKSSKSTNNTMKQTNTNVSMALFGAALQQELVRSLGDKPLKRYNQNPMKRPQNSIQNQAQSSQKPLRLAQTLGITPKPSTPLSPSKWSEIEQTLSKRLPETGGECPICCDYLGLRSTVMTSCSHAFHSNCLKQLEKFGRGRICPLCRVRDYQSTQTQMPLKFYKEWSALRIQKWFRGHLIRRNLLQSGVLSERMKQQLLMNRVKRNVYQWERYSQQNDSAIDALMAELDASVMQSRKIVSAAERELHFNSESESGE